MFRFSIPLLELGKLNITNSNLFDSYFKSLLKYTLEDRQDKKKLLLDIYNLLKQNLDCDKNSSEFPKFKFPKDLVTQINIFDKMLEKYFKIKKNKFYV